MPAGTRNKRGALPLPHLGRGWGEGVTGGSDRSEPPHPFLDVAKTSSPPRQGEGSRGDTIRRPLRRRLRFWIVLVFFRMACPAGRLPVSQRGFAPPPPAHFPLPAPP